MARELLDELAFAERPVDDHRHAAVARQRQDAVLHLAIEHVVGDLDEVERLLAHDLLEVAVAAALGRRDPDVADLALRPSSRASVRRCASQDSRLCTCRRSNFGTPQSRRDASICAGPRAPDEIQTLSAENRLAGAPSFLRP